MEEGKVSVRFLNVELISKTLLPRPHDFDGRDFRFDFKAENHLVADKKLAFTFVNISIRDLDKEPELATFIIVCVFEFPDFENVFKTKEKNQFI